MVFCCVPNCSSGSRSRNEKEKLSFHEIPSKMETRNQWITFISNLSPDGKPWSPHENGRTCLCNKHFRDEDFVTGSKYRVLKRGAVPSIFECNIVGSALASCSNTDVHQTASDLNDPAAYFQHPTTDTSSQIVMFDYFGNTSVVPEFFPQEEADLGSRCQMPGAMSESSPESMSTTCRVVEASCNDLLSHDVDETPEFNVSDQSENDLNTGTITVVDVIDEVPNLAPTIVMPVAAKLTAISTKCQRISVKDRKKIYHNPLDAIRILRQRIASKRAQICRLRRTVHTLEEANSRNGGGSSRNDENRDAKKLRTAAEAGDPSAIFLLDMVRARHMKHSRCSEVTVRYCKLLRARFPAAYEFIRKSGLLRFPSRQTLGRYGGQQYITVVKEEEPLIEQEVLMDDLCQPSEIVLDSSI